MNRIEDLGAFNEVREHGLAKLLPGGPLQSPAECYNWRGEAWLVALGAEQFELEAECSGAAWQTIAKGVQAVRKEVAGFGAPQILAK